MEAFEEWWEKISKQNIGCSGMKWFGKIVWRAALEWVKREAISLDERGNSSRNVINKELEEN